MFKTALKLAQSRALSVLDWQALGTVLGCTVAMNILMLLFPLYSLQVYDRVMSSRSVDTLWLLTLVVVVVLTAHAVLDAMRQRLLLRIGNAYILALNDQVMDACLAQSARLAEPTGQPVRDLGSIRNFVAGQQGLSVIFDAPMIPFFLLVVYLLHPWLGHAMVLGIVVMLGVAVATELITGSALRQANESGQRSQRQLDGILVNAEVVEAMGMRQAMLAWWSKEQGRGFSAASFAGDQGGALASLAKWWRLILNVMMTGLGAWLAIHDQLTMGGLVAVSILSARGLQPMEALVGGWKHLVIVRGAVDRLNLCLEKFVRVESGMQLPVPKGELRLDRVVYTPPAGGAPILRGVSVALPAGCLLGVIGPSGAGKSTLIKLICGVWAATAGSVRIDGADVYIWNRADFGLYVGYLPQDVELFSGSVRENIARFRNGVKDEDVIAAAQMAGVHELILLLPKGYETQVGVGGATLSGGQRQRVGLARALFGSPRLVVLDEPNSSLDGEGELALARALAALKAAGATVVVVSHRPSVLAGADYLLVLANGAVDNFGPKEEILRVLSGSPQQSRVGQVVDQRNGHATA